MASRKQTVKTKFTVCFDKVTARGLAALAAREGMPVEQYIEQVMNDHVDEENPDAEAIEELRAERERLLERVEAIDGELDELGA